MRKVIARKFRSFLKGDSLIEVMFSVGIFGMVAVGAIQIMNRGLYTAQGSLESTMARQEIDAQAEALRFVHEGYISRKKSFDNPYKALWEEIEKLAIDASTEEGKDALEQVVSNYRTVASGSDNSCQAIYDSLPANAFVINPSVLGSETLSSMLAISDDAVVFRPDQTVLLQKESLLSPGDSSPAFRPAAVYPRLLYGADGSSLTDAPSGSVSVPALSSAEGVWIIPVASGSHTVIQCGENKGYNEPDYYDFYIQSCWDSPGTSQPSTLSTTVRLYNSDQISLEQSRQITFNSVTWATYGNQAHKGYKESKPRFVPGDSTCSYYASEPAADEHVYFPDENSIILQGTHIDSFSGGAFYDKFDANREFILDVDVDTDWISTHPQGRFNILFDLVDPETGATLPNGTGINFEIYGNASKIKTRSQSETIKSRQFHLTMTHKDGYFKACVKSEKDDFCIDNSADSERFTTGANANLKVEYKLTHGSHACSCTARVDLSNIDMHWGDLVAPGGVDCDVSENKWSLYYDRNLDGDGEGKINFGGRGVYGPTSYDVGADATIASIDSIFKDHFGHRFLSWNTKKDGSGTSYNAGDTYPSPASARNYFLYAQWETNAYTVHYNANGGSGSMSSETADPGLDYTISISSFTPPEDYELVSWNTKPDGSGASYPLSTTSSLSKIPAGSYANGAEVTLYAQYAELAYDIIFDGNGATSGSMPAQHILFSKTAVDYLLPNQFKRDGYIFDGWNRQADGKGETFGDGALVATPSADELKTKPVKFTLYAKWKPETNKYSITFDINGGYKDGFTYTAESTDTSYAFAIGVSKIIHDHTDRQTEFAVANTNRKITSITFEYASHATANFWGWSLTKHDIIDSDTFRSNQRAFVDYDGAGHNMKIDLTVDNPSVTLYAVWVKDIQHKPIIYLYPETETEASVKLGYPELLTTVYPAYGDDGWHVLAQPDGTLINLETQRKYYALYWEGLALSKPRLTEGFVVKGEDSAAFLEEKLALLGLSDREAEEMIVYWLPILESAPYNLIRFETFEEIERAMPLDVTPRPDTVIRVMMDYAPLTEPVDVPEQILPLTPERKGFTVVEWGGSQVIYSGASADAADFAPLEASTNTSARQSFFNSLLSHKK